MSNNKKERESKPIIEEGPKDPDEIASLEARNALLQFDRSIELIQEGIAKGEKYKLRPSTALELNRLAIDMVNEHAGGYRPHQMQITGSKHTPPQKKDLPRLMEDMCDYVNENWTKSAIHLASYVMWRINWIHPFPDGNGRTARALSHVVLCIKVGYLLPGEKTIPEQISSDKFPYYDALEAADEADRKEEINVSGLEKLLSGMLATQLYDLHQSAIKEGAVLDSTI